MRTQLLEFIERLTQEPGVYRMRNAANEVLYVGKAVNLKKRVASYFNQSNQGAKTNALVSQIASIDVSVTRNETEALLLESSLIKALRPRYNVLMRDDKSYPYLHLSCDETFPSLKSVRCKNKPQKNGYYGPYPGLLAVRETLNIIQKIFNIRNCSNAFFNARSRPCLQYQLKRCSAPCTGLISAQAYGQSVQEAVHFLQGKSLQVIQRMEARMQDAVAQLAFEEAARLRDQIKSLRHIQEQQHVVRLRGDVDVIVIYVRPGLACVQWVMIRQGQISDSQRFLPRVPTDTLGIDDLWQQVFEGFITHYYQDNPTRIPPLILTNHAMSQQAALEQVLTTWRGRTCRITRPTRGNPARWLDFALDNLRQASQEAEVAGGAVQERYVALQHLLSLHAPIEWMICFDISHTQGNETVASCVVFDASGPCTRAYRHFAIQGITPGDDCAAIEQVVERYFRRLSPNQWPNVVVIDGGKGQVAAAQKALHALTVVGVKVIGIFKGMGRKAMYDRLLDASSAQEIAVSPDSCALHLVQWIRDEAHRFALRLHRKKRQRVSLGSSLFSIQGIGSTRHAALLQRFGGIRELAKASVAEIAKVPGISQTLALAVHEHFHKNKG